MIPTILFFQSATLTSKSWRDKLSGTYRYATEAGWHVQMIHTNTSPSDIRESIALYRPLGCIVDRSRWIARPPNSFFGGLPVVLMDQNPRTAGNRYSCINHDSTATARLAAEELLKLGLSAYTYVPWFYPTAWSLEREKGFAQTIRAAGKTYIRWTDPNNIAEQLALLSRPCGILCANDQVAKDIIARATLLGLKIPDDLAIIGIDNDELICEHTQPSLTSILPDFEQGGYLAAQMLAELIRNPHLRTRTINYGPREIFRRESTRHFAKSDPRVRKAISYIHAHAFDPGLRSDDVIREMHCTQTFGNRRFREITGHTIRDEIQSLRLEKAFRLLRNPNQAITPISTFCGYQSEAFFKRLFKQTTGQTMREWQKSHAMR